MTLHDEPTDRTRNGLQHYGFRGFVPFASLASSDVPEEPGVYCVIRPAVGEPEFRPVSPAGHYQGKDPTASLSQLEALWVSGATVVYIGKANHGGNQRRGLRKRLQE